MCRTYAETLIKKPLTAVVVPPCWPAAVSALLLLPIGLTFGAEATTTRRQIALECEKGKFTAVKVENTHKRSYTQDAPGSTGTKQTCDLTESAKGVIWRLVLEGHTVDWRRLSLRNERGQEFIKACWSRTATGIYAPPGGLIEFLAAGPEDSRKLTLCCADKCADVEVLK